MLGKVLLGIINELLLEVVSMLPRNDLTNSCYSCNVSEVFEVWNTPVLDVKVQKELVPIYPSCVTDKERG